MWMKKLDMQSSYTRMNHVSFGRKLEVIKNPKEEENILTLIQIPGAFLKN